jgi:hypothetical protein
LEHWTAEKRAQLDALMTDSDFREATTRREQIRVAVKLLRPFVNGQRFTLEQIGVFFGGLQAATIPDQNRLSLQSPKSSDPPLHLSDAITQWMVEGISTRFEARNPITYAELVDLLQIHHQVSIASDTLRHVIRNLDTVCHRHSDGT